jgi:hypothetical protein
MFSPQRYKYDGDGDGNWWHDYSEKFGDTEDRDREAYRSCYTHLENGLHPVRYCYTKAIVAGRQLCKSCISSRICLKSLISRVRKEGENGGSANWKRVKSANYTYGN